MVIARAVSACLLCAVMLLPYGAPAICAWAHPEMVAMAAPAARTDAPVLASSDHESGSCDFAQCGAAAVAPAVRFDQPALHVGARFAYLDTPSPMPRPESAPLTPPPLA